MNVPRTSDPLFFGVTALLFLGSAALTIVWCAQMSAMSAMVMPGGWTMSMTWMRMPGQSWPEAAASFLLMWTVMMVAMMLPSLVPALRQYRQAIGPRAKRSGLLTTAVGLGYFAVWSAFGAAAFPLGVALAALTMERPSLARAVPTALGGVVLLAGMLQISEWKARHLACSRRLPEQPSANARSAWTSGVRLGLHCARCCAPLMTVLLVLGVMELWAMGLVTAAMTLERVARDAERVALAIGVITMAGGVFLALTALT